MITIQLTTDIINTLKLLRLQNGEKGCEILRDDMYVCSSVMENIIRVMGEYENFIPGSDFSFEGHQWPKETEDRAWEIHTYIRDNLKEILSILIFYCDSGVKPGIYKRKERMDGIWDYFPFPEGGN
jgi:hypothetical protein